MTNGYALGQLARAFLTATTHEDDEVRRGADRRAQQWSAAIAGMADGSVRVGKRAPVRGLPSWVTLDVLRGGFATGSPAAEQPLQADEVAWAQRLGIPATRRSIFSVFLTDSGLQELYALLDSGAYRVEIPEDAALLTMAWLVRAGDRDGALDVLDAVAPFSERFRLAPKIAPAPTTPPDLVHRITAGEAAASLRARKPAPRVEAQREALAVWNPFGDRVLALWLERCDDEGRIILDGDTAWRARAAEMIDEYDRLALIHTGCSKHRKPKENLAILLRGLRVVTEGGQPGHREVGQIRTAVASSVAKRGVPGGKDHTRLRRAQRLVAAAPGHAALALVAAGRLTALDHGEGITDPRRLLGEVTAAEEARTGVPEGHAMPPIVPRLLNRARSAPIETLLEEGVVPSAEVLAALVPAISAGVVASGFSDRALAALAAANYRAFRRRRSLLLLNLEKQVQIIELPWVRVAARHSEVASDEAMSVARRVGALALDHFPATILPNPLVHELQHLLAAAGHDIPLVEELAADIFMGRFSDTFRRAAQVAARVVGGTLYARYYGIDVDEIQSLQKPSRPKTSAGQRLRRARPTSSRPNFVDLCMARAGRQHDGSWSVAGNGTVIEQCQILTTHNLAAFVSIGIEPRRPWGELAGVAIERTAALLGLASRQRLPLATVKDAAYAWRQAVFFLSMADAVDADQVLRDGRFRESGPPVMADLVDGLRSAASGGTPVDVRTPFLGWTVGRHWVLDAIDGTADR